MLAGSRPRSEIPQHRPAEATPERHAAHHDDAAPSSHDAETATDPARSGSRPKRELVERTADGIGCGHDGREPGLRGRHDAMAHHEGGPDEQRHDDEHQSDVFERGLTTLGV